MKKSSDLPGLKSTLSRRTVLTGIAAGAVTLALPAILPSRAFAATPGSNPGKYKIDLGGYSGPELTSAPITLKIMRQEYPPEVNEVMNAQYAAFSAAYPNITIQEERVPYGDLPTKVQVYVASGQAPDIMMGRNDFASAYAAGELTLPLQQFFSADFIADVYGPLRESATIDGNLVCLPWETNPVYMAFNRDIFDKLGITPPPEVAEYDGGWTVEDYLKCFDDVTKALRASGDQQTFALAASGYGNGGPGSNYTQLESIWVRMMGDPNAAKDSSAYNTFMGVSEDGFTASGYVNTAEAAAGMANYKAVFANGYTPTGVVPDQFRGGAAAITFSGTGTVKRFLKTGQPFNFGMSPAPKGTIAYTTTVADSPVIFSGTPYPAETAALLAFICNDANRFAFHEAWGSMPVRKTLVDALPEYASDQRLKLGTNVADHAFGPPKSMGWFDYFSAINPAVKDIALGADPQARLNDVATQIDGLLAKYK
jgi:multiple sugar transport system substrate-binding protein